MFALPFLLMVCAMAFELSRDMLRVPRLECELRESGHRLDLAARAGGLGLWSWDIRTGLIWSTTTARQLLGFSERDASDPERWRERIHPADSERVRLAVDQVLRAGGEYDIEHRIAAFQQENEAWASIWKNSYREVERTMCTFRAMSLTDRAGASRWLLDWHDKRAREGNGIPFRTEAEGFAEVYWRSRG